MNGSKKQFMQRSGRREREARARVRRRILFVIGAVGLIVGVQAAVDSLTRNDWGGIDEKEAAFAPPSVGGVDAPGAPTGVLGGAGAAGAAASALPSGMDPSLKAKASQLQKRYADKLSSMSTQDKMRAFSKASKLLGRDVSGMMGR